MEYAKWIVEREELKYKESVLYVYWALFIIQSLKPASAHVELSWTPMVYANPIYQPYLFVTKANTIQLLHTNVSYAPKGAGHALTHPHVSDANLKDSTPRAPRAWADAAMEFKHSIKDVMTAILHVETAVPIFAKFKMGSIVLAQNLPSALWWWLYVGMESSVELNNVMIKITCVVTDVSHASFKTDGLAPIIFAIDCLSIIILHLAIQYKMDQLLHHQLSIPIFSQTRLIPHLLQIQLKQLLKLLRLLLWWYLRLWLKWTWKWLVRLTWTWIMCLWFLKPQMLISSKAKVKWNLLWNTNLLILEQIPHQHIACNGLSIPKFTSVWSFMHQGSPTRNFQYISATIIKGKSVIQRPSSTHSKVSWEQGP